MFIHIHIYHRAREKCISNYMIYTHTHIYIYNIYESLWYLLMLCIISDGFSLTIPSSDVNYTMSSYP